MTLDEIFAKYPDDQGGFCRKKYIDHAAEINIGKPPERRFTYRYFSFHELKVLQMINDTRKKLSKEMKDLPIWVNSLEDLDADDWILRE